MNIGFDAKRAFLNFTGLGNYSRFIINGLQENFPYEKYFLFTPKGNNHSEVIDLRQANTQVVMPSRLLLRGGLWRTYGIRFEESVKELDVYHGLSAELPVGLHSSIRQVVTIHDLIFLRYPELYNPVDCFIYSRKARRACEKADKIVAISQQTAQDVVDFYKIDPSKIKVVHLGCHAIFRKALAKSEIDAVKSKYQLPQEYLLSVGTIEKRKNLELVINALAHMSSDRRIKLVVVGRKTRYFNEVVELARYKKVDDWVIFLHQVGFADLPAIYQGSRIFIFPSRFEGFGIPIVEAIESSVPVIAATGSCLQEAGGPDSVYVDPNSYDELAYEIQRLLGSEDLSKAICAKSKEFVKRFHRGPISKEMMAIYKG
jgi:glycosyltransferase involved in cell wall biosynthesis